MKDTNKSTNVLVTGGTGFLAGWTIRKLLEKGYSVRTIVRSMKKSEKVVNMLQYENVDTRPYPLRLRI